MGATCFTGRQCGLYLLGALLVVNVCGAPPAAVQGRAEKTGAQSTALATIPPNAGTGVKQTTKPENVTAANKNATAPNATAASNATHVNGSQGGANTTVHEHAEATTEGGVKTEEGPTYYFSSWIAWREDNYLMSIMIPVACGVGAAVLILCSLACIGCCRRRCRSRRGRRNLPKKIDPKTFRKMKAADRIKLLAASSDEEF